MLTPEQPKFITLDGLTYELSKIPVHVLQLMNALGDAQRRLAEAQAQVTVYTHATMSISQQIKGAFSMIAPYVPEPAAEEAQTEQPTKDVHKD